MKRLTVIVCLVLVFFISLYLVLLCLAFTPCNIGITDGADIDIGESSKFSKEDIRSAVNCVIEKFKEFSGCRLKKIEYDEEWSNIVLGSYMSSGNGLENNVKSENVIVLFSDFYVDSSGGDGSLEPNSTYTDWNWILIRDSKTSSWRVDDWGI